MSNYRQVGDDILRDWLNYRDDTGLAFTNAEDRKHEILFDEICEKIINHIPEDNRDFVQRKLNKLDDNLMDYVGYWNEKYYRNGFVDGSQLVMGCLEE